MYVIYFLRKFSNDFVFTHLQQKPREGMRYILDHLVLGVILVDENKSSASWPQT